MLELSSSDGEDEGLPVALVERQQAGAPAYYTSVPKYTRRKRTAGGASGDALEAAAREAATDGVNGNVLGTTTGGTTADTFLRVVRKESQLSELTQFPIWIRVCDVRAILEGPPCHRVAVLGLLGGATAPRAASTSGTMHCRFDTYVRSL